MASVNPITARAMAHAKTSTTNRRALLGGIAVAPFAAHCPKIHPDRKLLDLERQRALAHVAYDIASAQAQALHLIGVPEAPAALFLRESDHALGLGGYATRRGDGTLWFYPDAGNASIALRKPRTRDETQPVPPGVNLPRDAQTITRRVPWAEAQVRADEIVTAFDRWRHETAEARRASGYAVASEEADKLGSEVTRIEREIELTPPNTLDGISVKAQHLRRCLNWALDIDEYLDVFIGELLLIAQTSDVANLTLCPETMATA
ncbi:hypothetical protein [Methylobacterium sp. CCH5-D2]|uniref:hypothetical protein n=1 Tax=Methylobacterium sp. CCH5-D2 TaxID=1768765 RepID=UPI000836A89D|nr:hypothetical protein [Methylobacterium sp. CCH5-D2]